MTVSAQIQITQGATIGVAGRALFGTTGTPVVYSNSDNTNVIRWVWTVIASPPGSSLVPGTIQDGVIPTFTFTPDLVYGYLIRLDVYDTGGLHTALDIRAFGVKDSFGIFVPPFEGDSSSLNFGGQTRGWAPYMEGVIAFLEALNNLSAVGGGREISLLAGFEEWGQNTFDLVGSRVIDMSPYPTNIGLATLKAKFFATVYMTPGATSVEVRLYDATDGVTVTGADLTSSSTNPVEVSSGFLTIGSASGNLRNDAPKTYEIDVKMNGGTIGTDQVFVANARLVLTYS